jgi:hypothetical protein
MPVDNENDLEFTRMASRRSDYRLNKEAFDCDSYAMERLSTTQAVHFRPGRNCVAGGTHCL